MTEKMVMMNDDDGDDEDCDDQDDDYDDRWRGW